MLELGYRIIFARAGPDSRTPSDVLRCVGKELFVTKMDIRQELGLLRLRPDIMVLTVGTMEARLAVGVCEVKKPRSGILRDPTVLGQLFNHMQALRTSSGILEVFGILNYTGLFANAIQVLKCDVLVPAIGVRSLLSVYTVGKLYIRVPSPSVER